VKLYHRAFLLQNMVRDDDGLHWRINLGALDRHVEQVNLARGHKVHGLPCGQAAT